MHSAERVHCCVASTEPGVAFAHMPAAETTGMATEATPVATSALRPQRYSQEQPERRDGSQATHALKL